MIITKISRNWGPQGSIKSNPSENSIVSLDLNILQDGKKTWLPKNFAFILGRGYTKTSSTIALKLNFVILFLWCPFSPDWKTIFSLAFRPCSGKGIHQNFLHSRPAIEFCNFVFMMSFFPWLENYFSLKKMGMQEQGPYEMRGPKEGPEI